MKSKTTPVLFFESQYYMFSNFSSFSIDWDEKRWMTAEHLYQATKFPSPLELREDIRKAPSAYQAKMIARAHNDLRPQDWDQIKLGVMERILRLKLAQHTVVREALLKTGNRKIIENSPKDSFWGWGRDKKGHNHLGKLWMKLRKELKKKQK